MAKIELNIPDEHLPIVVDALCGIDYQEEVPNPNYGQEGEPQMIPNPMTRGQFAKVVVLDYVKHRVRAYREGIINSNASTQAKDEVESMGLS
jgi:hypothetical protein